MASYQDTYDIIFGGKDKVSGVARDIMGNMDKLRGAASTVAAPISLVTDGILAANAALLALAAGGVISSVAAFADFEDTMLAVKGFMQASPEEYEGLSKAVKQLGIETRYSAAEVAEGLRFLAAAGLTVAEAHDALPQVLNLATAAFTDMGTTADIVTNTMSQFGIGASELSRVTDVMTATFTSSNTDLVRLGKAFEFVGPVAAGLGVSLESTSAALGILAKAGYSGEKGGTALRNVLLALVAPTTSMGLVAKKLGVDLDELGIDATSSKNALKNLGVEVKGVDGNLRPITDIFRDLIDGLQKIPDEADKTGALMQIFGKRGGPQLKGLLTIGIDAVDELEKKIRESGGITTQIAEQMESGIGGSLRRLTSAFEGFKLATGAKIEIAPIEGLTDIFAEMAKLVEGDAFKPIFDAVNNFSAELGELMSEAARQLPEAFKILSKDDAFASLIALLDEIGGDITGIFEDFDLTTPEGLADALGKVVDTITSLIRVTQGIAESFAPVWGFIIEGIEHVNSLDAESQKAFGNILGSAKLVTMAGAEIAAAFFVIQKSGASIGAVFDLLVGTATGIGNAFQVAFSAAALYVVEFVDEVLEVTEAAAGLAAPFSDSAEEISKSIKETRKTVGEFSDAIQEDIINQSDEMKDGFSQAWDGITGGAEKAKDAVKQVGDAVKAVPDEKRTDLTVDPKDQQELEYWTKILNETEGERTARINFDATQAIKEHEKLESLKDTVLAVSFAVGYKDQKDEDIIKYVGDAKEKTKEVKYNFTVDGKSYNLTQKQIADLAGKELEIKAKLDTAKIEASTKKFEANAKTIQTAVEWEAKLNIAKAEADANKFIALMESSADIITSAGDAMGDMFGQLNDVAQGDFSTKWKIEDAINQQMELQREEFELRKRAAEQEMEYKKALTEEIESGEARFKIEFDPEVNDAVEALARFVIDKIQEITTSAEGFEALQKFREDAYK